VQFSREALEHRCPAQRGCAEFNYRCYCGLRRQTLQAVQRAVNSVTARGLCSRYGKPRKGSQMGYLYQEDRAPAAPKPQSCLADVVLTIVAMFAIMFLLR
jgi:hypothetical protein